MPVCFIRLSFYVVRFNAISCKNFVFIIKRDLPMEEKMSIVISYIKHYNWLFDDETEFDIFPSVPNSFILTNKLEAFFGENHV